MVRHLTDSLVRSIGSRVKDLFRKQIVLRVVLLWFKSRRPVHKAMATCWTHQLAIMSRTASKSYDWLLRYEGDMQLTHIGVLAGVMEFVHSTMILPVLSAEGGWCTYGASPIPLFGLHTASWASLWTTDEEHNWKAPGPLSLWGIKLFSVLPRLLLSNCWFFFFFNWRQRWHSSNIITSF